MSATKVRKYFEKIAKDLGYRISEESKQGRNVSAQAQKTAFVEIGPAQMVKTDMRSNEFEASVIVELTVGKSLKTQDIEQKALDASEQYLMDALINAKSAEFQKVSLVRYSAEAIDETNDTVLIGRIEFDAKWILGF